MDKIWVKEIKLERGKWAKRDLEQGKKVQRKHILVTVVFEDKDGNEISWCPRYTELKEILLHLEALHGDIEVFACILGDGDVEGLRNSLEEE